MYSTLTFQSIALKDILLDEKNPRIVTQTKLTSQAEILKYFYEHEDLEAFVKKIASDGKNRGAERPYIVKGKGGNYTVIEGNTRIAAYKILTGLLSPPSGYGPAPTVSASVKTSLLSVDCSIAPSREVLLPIMANAHFGVGDKSKWGYLGSRKAVYDEWKGGMSVAKLARAFDRSQGQIKELLLEYLLYKEALGLSWSKQEKEVLLNPSVEFNPPVRFLQTRGHKAKVGISYDATHVAVIFDSAEAKKKFRHLLKKLVIAPEKGLGATATFEQVFEDYTGPSTSTASGSQAAGSQGNTAGGTTAGSAAGSGSSSSGAAAGSGSGGTKNGALFAYPVTVTNAVVSQLMREAKSINGTKLPAAGTFLLRNIVESLLKHIIENQKANTAGTTLDLAGAINLCLTNKVTLTPNDKKILVEFRRQYMDYLNLGAHGTVVPNPHMLFGARDLIDQFIMKNV